MGLAGGKMKCPSGDMKFLLEQTKWSKEEIQWRYTNFIVSEKGLPIVLFMDDYIMGGIRISTQGYVICLLLCIS